MRYSFIFIFWLFATYCTNKGKHLVKCFKFSLLEYTVTIVEYVANRSRSTVLQAFPRCSAACHGIAKFFAHSLTLLQAQYSEMCQNCLN
jgi:hypothetical protein